MIFKLLTGILVVTALVRFAQADPVNLEAAPPVRAVFLLVKLHGLSEAENQSLEAHLKETLN